MFKCKLCGNDFLNRLINDICVKCQPSLYNVRVKDDLTTDEKEVNSIEQFERQIDYLQTLKEKLFLTKYQCNVGYSIDCGIVCIENAIVQFKKALEIWEENFGIDRDGKNTEDND
jgi:Fe-S-cluster-containing hydrogenase component 2